MAIIKRTMRGDTAAFHKLPHDSRGPAEAPSRAKKGALTGRDVAIMLFLIVLVVFVVGTVFARDSRTEEIYQKALYERAVGNLDEAMDLFSSIGDYKDAETQLMLTLVEKNKKYQKQGGP